MASTSSTPPTSSMPAYIVAHFTIRDPAAFQVFVEGVDATMAPFGGNHLFFGQVAVVYEGPLLSQLVAALQFPNQAAVQGWFSSQAFQEILVSLKRGADVQITSYNGINIGG